MRRWWWWLLLPPAAALAVGTPIRAPRLLAPIPDLDDATCDYAGAKESYLLAYAYAKEAPARSRGLLAAAEAERARCSGDTAVLAARIAKLRTSLP